MLKYLTIHNYAIVSKLSLELADGLSVITGETGAGKSITFDALSYILGHRADSRVVRQGADRCELIAEFLIRSERVAEWLKSKDLNDGDQCILKRVIHKDGRSRSFINDQPCSLQTTRELASQLVLIHGQHENQSLLTREGQRRLLDAYAQHNDLVEQVRTHYQTISELQQQLVELTEQDEKDKVAFIEYQLNELDECDLENFDLQALETEQHTLANATQIIENCQQTLNVLADGDTAAEAYCIQAEQLLQQLPESAQRQELLGLLSSIQINLAEVTHQVRDYANEVQVDPQALLAVEAKLEKLYHLARKHRVKPAELPATYQQLQQTLHELSQRESQLIALQARYDAVKSEYQTLADELSERRQQAARQLQEAVVPYCQELGMPHAQFEIHCQADPLAPKPNGHDTIEFKISTNPGQALQPLSKVASGGELSRMSLAIQVVTASVQDVPTLLFDEIDVGISGSTAAIVGKLLRELAKHAQILCVTHQAQVASFAEHHFQVAKASDGKLTESQIRQLSAADKVSELARLLGGMEVTKKTLAHAKDLLSQAS